jgi:hypothetical protein
MTYSYFVPLCTSKCSTVTSLRQKHGTAVQVERTEPFLARVAAPTAREAAVAYERREEPATPYRAFAANRELPAPAELRDERL